MPFDALSQLIQYGQQRSRVERVKDGLLLLTQPWRDQFAQNLPDSATPVVPDVSACIWLTEWQRAGWHLDSQPKGFQA